MKVRRRDLALAPIGDRDRLTAEGSRIMKRTFLASIVAASVLMSGPAYAQTDLGGLRGYAKDDQGAVLPGVSVTVTGPAILRPVIGVTDADGYYRLVNLPPGTVVLTAELQGFASYRQEGIVIRAGSTFAVDIEMKLATVAETDHSARRIADDRDAEVDHLVRDLRRAVPRRAGDRPLGLHRHAGHAPGHRFGAGE